ncbi:UNVERIFIED_CONTAM: Retrovirus-related Pol polyprotein from transposon RE1 [Sesamum latifolium]|uniref:Retrovirus-related Pol polyprotein from transposon RE1 n=1 Tax=Sesamum latifolium TaxID=2727402 RepID=A0AAW2UL23_9LAMI
MATFKKRFFVEQPEGYKIKGQEAKVYHLKKALYGIKQAPRAWNSKISGYFVENGFNRSASKSSLYIKNFGENFVVVCLYVDDLIYFGTNQSIVDEFKKKMMKDFEMTYLGLMQYFLGIQVQQRPGRIFLYQEKYIDNLLKKFKMTQRKPVTTPMAANENFQVHDDAEMVDESLYRKLIGSLLYLNTRQDINYAVSLLSRFMSEPSKIHFAKEF